MTIGRGVSAVIRREWQKQQKWVKLYAEWVELQKIEKDRHEMAQILVKVDTKAPYLQVVTCLVQGLVTRRGVCIMWWPVAPLLHGTAADLLTSIFSSNYFSAHSKQGVSCTHHRQQVLIGRTF